jgi:hypothetical protein
MVTMSTFGTKQTNRAVAATSPLIALQYGLLRRANVRSMG